MSTTTWHYLENQFLNVTGDTFKKADILIADHYAKLDAEKSDAVILVLFNRFVPVKAVWDTRYTNWISADAIYRGETDRFEEMIKDLGKGKIALWDAKVQIVFAEETSDYIIIFPDGRTPFKEGTYERKIAETEALAQRLGNYPALAALQTEVQTFANDLNTARNTQQSKEDLLSQASDLLEDQRIKICNMLYANLGRLMDKFNADTDNIARFFELSIMRRMGGDDFPRDGIFAGLETKNVIERSFDANTQLLLKNPGITPIMYCLSATADGACTAGVIIQPNSEEIHPVSDLGDTANTFLNVTNLGAVQGSWEVEEV